MDSIVRIGSVIRMGAHKGRPYQYNNALDVVRHDDVSIRVNIGKRSGNSCYRVLTIAPESFSIISLSTISSNNPVMFRLVSEVPYMANVNIFNNIPINCIN